MSWHRVFLALSAFGLLSLGGCVAYPVDGVYAQPASIYVAPPPVFFGGGYGGYGGYRPYYGGYGHGGGKHGGGKHGGWGHRGWR